MTDPLTRPAVAVTLGAESMQRHTTIPAAELARPFRRPITEAATSPDRGEPALTHDPADGYRPAC